jgi:hypothetical protein
MKRNAVFDVMLLLTSLGYVGTGRAERINLLYVQFTDKIITGIGCHSCKESFDQLFDGLQDEINNSYPLITQFFKHMSQVTKSYRDLQYSDRAFLCVDDWTEKEAKQFITTMPYVHNVRYLYRNNKNMDNKKDRKMQLPFYQLIVEEVIRQNFAREVLIKDDQNSKKE